MEAKIVERPSFTVVGLQVASNDPTLPIDQLWVKFNARRDELATESPLSYGLCFDGTESCFQYIAGVELTAGEAVPDGMATRHVAASRYAVFTSRGHVENIAQTFHRAFTEWLPAQRLVPRFDAPHFELYDERYIAVDAAENEVDIYIAIQPQ